MLVKVCTTNEISEKEWLEIVSGFNEAFDAKVTIENFKNYYTSKCLGFSFHSLAIDDNGRIAGSTTIVPYRYVDKNGRVFMTGLSGGSYIRKDFRKDEFLFSEMYNALRRSSSNFGLELILGMPNNNSFMYVTKFLQFRYLFDLDYYILPLRVSKILKKSRLGILNFISLFFASLWILFSSFLHHFFNSGERKYNFSIVNDNDFYRQRLDDRYKSYQKNGFRYWYRIVDENDLKTAYILDFREGEERTAKALVKAVWRILFSENADIIAFIGTLGISQLVLFKLPAAMIPRRFRLTVDVLKSNNSDLKNSYLCPDNWSFSLLNFDVR
jgi:hypothetical protein